MSVNGTVLSTSQAMTMRVALQSFTSHLVETGLGGDVRDMALAEAYLDCAREVDALMRLARPAAGRECGKPGIVVNDVALSPAQAQTLTSALQHLVASLKKHGLGDDLHGLSMTKAYLARAGEVNALLLGDPVEPSPVPGPRITLR